MSKNCIQCVKNVRTGHDLLCDECRGTPIHPSRTPYNPIESQARYNAIRKSLTPLSQIEEGESVVIEAKDRDALLAQRVMVRVYDDCQVKPDGTLYGLHSDVTEIIRAQTLETSNCAFRAGFRAAVERARPQMRCLETMAVMSEAWIDFTHAKGGDALGEISAEIKALFEECRHMMSDLRWSITMCDPHPKAPINQEDIAKLIYEVDKMILVAERLAGAVGTVCGDGTSGNPELSRAKRANDSSSASAGTGGLSNGD